MGWFSKVLGIDSRKHKEQDARDAAAKAQAAQDAAAAQAAQTAAQSKQYNDSMLEVQRQSLQASKDAAAAESKRISDAQVAAQTLAGNNSVDLRADTTANVVAGGTADAIAVDASKKKKAGASSLSSQLGINV